jgi:hypothetical protein
MKKLICFLFIAALMGCGKNPLLSMLPDNASYLDHFDNSSLNAWWTAHTSGTGSIVESGTILTLTHPELDNAALISGSLESTYDFTVKMKCNDKPWDQCRCLSIFDNGWSRNVDTFSNISPHWCILFNYNNNSNKYQLIYIDTGGTQHFWTGTAWTSTSTDWFGAADTYFRFRFVKDGTNFSIYCYDAEGTQINNTAVIAKSSVRNGSNDGYFALGWARNEGSPTVHTDFIQTIDWIDGAYSTSALK